MNGKCQISEFTEISIDDFHHPLNSPRISGTELLSLNPSKKSKKKNLVQRRCLLDMFLVYLLIPKK